MAQIKKPRMCEAMYSGQLLTDSPDWQLGRTEALATSKDKPLIDPINEVASLDTTRSVTAHPR